MDGSTDPTEIDAGTDPNDSSSVPGIDPGIDPGLLVHYTFDDDTAANSGTGGDGTLVGGGTFGPGVSGNAWQGNRTGANDGYIQTGLTGTALGMGPNSVYTAMAWVKWDGASGNVDHMVFGQEDGPGNKAMLHHGIRADSENNAHYGGWGNDLGDAGVVPVGEWTHLAFQFDGADKVVFVNGVETARGAGGTMSGHAMDVIVGGHGRDAADPAGNSFNGAIDEVRMYDEVLTRQQIMAVMAPTLASDSDGDGLNDDDEVTVYFTDPDDADSDDDGMDDGVEVANMLDPNSGDGDDGAEGDPDMDGLSNLDELEVYFTNPLSEDSDMDGSTDPTEIDAGTDPNDSSSVPGIDPGIDLSGLLLYYSFDVEDGVNVENTGTLETAGMISGGVTYGESKEPSFGTAFYGNRTGANDAYIQTGFTGTVLGLGPDSVYTAMAWVKWDGASGNVDHMVFGQEDGPGNRAMLHHGIRADSENNVHYGGWGNDLGDAGVVPVGEWTHLAFQFDGADKVVFVNGVETARGGGSTMSGHAMDVIIGGHGRDAADPAGNSFNGAIDEVRIYGGVLEEEQIQAAMIPNAGSGPKDLEVRSIDYDSESDTVTLTFTSRPGRSYSLFSTYDFQDGPDYLEIDDGIDADAGETITSYTFPAPDNDLGGGSSPKAFFFIKQN
jgi:hypothetical protein